MWWQLLKEREVRTMTIINELENIPECFLTCENHECFKDTCFGTRKYAHAVEVDEDTGKEFCPFYIGPEDHHEYD